jgi:hypothetical protein
MNEEQYIVNNSILNAAEVELIKDKYDISKCFVMIVIMSNCGNNVHEIIKGLPKCYKKS